MDKRNIEIGRRIKQFRKGKMTQHELAAKIGKTESSVRKYEKGLISIPLDTLESIAKALSIPTSDLFSDIFDYWDSSMGDIDNLIEEVKDIERITSLYGEGAVDLLHLYNCLNQQGKGKATAYLTDLSEHPKYKK